MTVIAYSKGMLAADSRALQNIGDEEDLFSAHRVVKLKVLAHKTFAVAVCGPVPTSKQWETIEQVFLKNLVICELISEASFAYFSKKELKQIDGYRRYFLVLTKNHVYYMSPVPKDEDGGLTQVEFDTDIAYGTGARLAYLALQAGRNTKEATEFVTTIDHLCGMPVLSVKQADLKGFSEDRPDLEIFVKKMVKRRENKQAVEAEEKA